VKVILLGATGLAGQAINAELKSRNLLVRTVARKNADILLDLTNINGLRDTLNEEAPDLVINAAAEVNINKCEENHSLAWDINTRIVGIIQEWADKNTRPFVQISTDHFFAEGGPKAHLETETVTLVNEYARQKYAAECLSLVSSQALVFRTSIVGIRAWPEKTFAEWALESIREDREISMYDDAWTSSIDARSFARALVDMVYVHEARGLYNVGSCEVYSKAQFIEELASQLNVKLTKASKCSVFDHFDNRATSLGLDITKIQKLLSWKLPTLRYVVRQIVEWRP
jgi:dTDP-4-dehydrorhamnose reductase